MVRGGGAGVSCNKLSKFWRGLNHFKCSNRIGIEKFYISSKGEENSSVKMIQIYAKSYKDLDQHYTQFTL